MTLLAKVLVCFLCLGLNTPCGSIRTFHWTYAWGEIIIFLLSFCSCVHEPCQVKGYELSRNFIKCFTRQRLLRCQKCRTCCFSTYTIYPFGFPRLLQMLFVFLQSIMKRLKHLPKKCNAGQYWLMFNPPYTRPFFNSKIPRGWLPPPHKFEF